MTPGIPEHLGPRGQVRTGSLMLQHQRCRCMICDSPFIVGDLFSMVEMKPASRRDAVKAKCGHAYLAMFEPVHWDCVVIRLATAAGFMRHRAEA